MALPTPVQLVSLSQQSMVQLWLTQGVSRHFNWCATEVLHWMCWLLVVSVGGARSGRLDQMNAPSESESRC